MLVCAARFCGAHNRVFSGYFCEFPCISTLQPCLVCSSVAFCTTYNARLPVLLRVTAVSHAGLVVCIDDERNRRLRKWFARHRFALWTAVCEGTVGLARADRGGTVDLVANFACRRTSLFGFFTIARSGVDTTATWLVSSTHCPITNHLRTTENAFRAFISL